MNLQESKNSTIEAGQHSFIEICLLLKQEAADIHRQLSKALGQTADSLRTVQNLRP